MTRWSTSPSGSEALRTQEQTAFVVEEIERLREAVRELAAKAKGETSS